MHTAPIFALLGLLAIARLPSAAHERDESPAVMTIERYPVPAGEPLPDITFDNGLPDGVTGVLVGPAGVFGGRRSVLEDAMAYREDAALLRFRGVWDTLPPGAGTGVSLRVREDACGAPGRVLGDLTVTSYREVPTGRMILGRPEFEATAEILDAPVRERFWIEATVRGPEACLWLTSSGRDAEAWVNFDDDGGLRPTSEAFGAPLGLSFVLYSWSNPIASVSCCLPDHTCVVWTNEDECAGLGGRGLVFEGDCDGVSCPETAACCLADGTCVAADTADECFALDGCSFDPLNDCAGVACAPSGACCLPDGGCLSFATPSECALTGGTHESAMTCAACPGSGACCLGDGSCLDDRSPFECAAAGGAPAGAGTTCANLSCFGACCTSSGCVEDLAPDDCAASGGLFGGPGRACGDLEDCATGACCLPEAACAEELLPGECAAAGGAFGGAATICADLVCPPLGACCLDEGGCAESASPEDCAGLGGAFRGAASRCADEPCATLSVCAQSVAEIRGSRIARKSIFGHALAFDGGRLLVGADDAGGPDDSGAYLFDEVSGAWTEVARFTDAETPGGGLGWDVDLAGDIAVVAAYDARFVIVYRESAGVWTERTRFVNPEGGFGWATATSGDVIAVGAPRERHGVYAGAVQVYRQDAEAPSGWTEPLTLLSSAGGELFEFGYAVDVDADEDVIVVGEPGSSIPLSRCGAAHVFRRDSSEPDTWIHEQVLQPLDLRTSLRFGNAVAIDGDRIVIGAEGGDAAYVFERNGEDPGVWKQTQSLARPPDVSIFGISVAIDGDMVVVGANVIEGFDQQIIARVYVREEGSGVWAPRALVIPRARAAHFEPRYSRPGGGAVAVEASTVVVGAPGHDEPGWLDDPDYDAGVSTILDVSGCAACAGDLDGDGTVALPDLLAVLTAWGPCGEGPCPADLDGSGAVDFADVLVVLVAWGRCAV